MIGPIKHGDILDGKFVSVVVPVNCVGVMGAGLAKQVAERWPEVRQQYEAFCHDGWLRIGHPLCVSNTDPAFIFLPTKKHWQDDSTVDIVRAGLKALWLLLYQGSITQVRVPALGCGYGRLSWGIMGCMMHRELSGLPDVRIEIYAPQGRSA